MTIQPLTPDQIQIQPHQDAVKMEMDLARSIAATLASKGLFNNCCTCSKFIEVMERCEEFNARPPARIIAYGCIKHSHIIPF